MIKRVCTFGMGGNPCDVAVRGQPTAMCPDACEFLVKTFVAEVIEGGVIPVVAEAEMVDWKARYEELKEQHWECWMDYDANLHDMRLFLDSLLALADRFEEACAQPAEAAPCPGDGWYWVRGHWRSRKRNAPECPETAVDEPGGSGSAGDTPAGVLGASGDARGASWSNSQPQVTGE